MHRVASPFVALLVALPLGCASVVGLCAGHLGGTAIQVAEEGAAAIAERDQVAFYAVRGEVLREGWTHVDGAHRHCYGVEDAEVVVAIPSVRDHRGRSVADGTFVVTWSERGGPAERPTRVSVTKDGRSADLRGPERVRAASSVAVAGSERIFIATLPGDGTAEAVVRCPDLATR